MKELFLQTPDQFPLKITLFEPQVSNQKVLLLNAATGVKQTVYYSFAKFFQENGFTVITYDYRGIADSRPENLKNFEASMRIWGTVDFKTLTNFIEENYPNYSRFCVGHSVGALIIGMNEDSKNFEKFIFVGTQDAYIGNLNLKVAITALLGFGIALPVLTTILGYFPANIFGLGADLPKGVAYDWRTLILNKKSTARLYEKIEVHFAKHLTQEALIIHAEDDHWVTKKGMDNLIKNVYPNLKKTFREIKISESEKGEIGHVNFFRSYNKDLWNIILQQL